MVFGLVFEWLDLGPMVVIFFEGLMVGFGEDDDDEEELVRTDGFGMNRDGNGRR